MRVSSAITAAGIKKEMKIPDIIWNVKVLEILNIQVGSEN
jgi:hypothetical protein